MAAKPTASDATLRKLVREVLALAPGYGFTDAALTRSVCELLPANAAGETDVLRAAEWNFSRDYVSHRTNEDTDEREWLITQHGIAKQSVA